MTDNKPNQTQSMSFDLTTEELYRLAWLCDARIHTLQTRISANDGNDLDADEIDAFVSDISFFQNLAVKLRNWRETRRQCDDRQTETDQKNNQSA